MGVRKKVHGDKQVWEAYWVTRDSTGKRRTRSKVVHAPHTPAGKRQAKQVEADLIAEADDESLADVDEATTVEELVRSWIRFRSDDWSPGQAWEQQRRAELHVFPTLGAVRARDLTGRQLDELYRQLRKKLKPSSVGSVHRMLHAAFAQGLKWQILIANPANAATPPKQTKRELVVPSTEQVVDGLARLDRDPDQMQMALLVRLAAATGGRRGQLVALQWRDLELVTDDEDNVTGGTVTWRRALKEVPSADGVEVVEKTTKTENVWTLKIDAATATRLAAWKAHVAYMNRLHRRKSAETNWVFQGRPWGTWLHPGSVSRWWRRNRDDLGMPGVRFHDLRHYHATVLLSEGVDPKTVSHRIGHESLTTTLNIYAHAIPARDAAAADLIGGILDARTG